MSMYNIDLMSFHPFLCILCLSRLSVHRPIYVPGQQQQHKQLNEGRRMSTIDGAVLQHRASIDDVWLLLFVVDDRHMSLQVNNKQLVWHLNN